MIKKFKHKGLWYLPSNPERKVQGILKFDYKKNINTLELIGSFYDTSNYAKQDVILGTTTDGDDITLVECYFSSSTGIKRNEEDRFGKNNEDRLPTLNFRITTILKGQKVFKKEDLLFQRVYAEIFNFDEWVGITGLKVNDDQEDEHCINYKSPEQIEVSINDSIDLKIKFRSNYPVQSIFTKELSLNQKTIISFESKKYLTIDEFIYLLRKFKYFLSASLQIPLRIESLEFYSDKFSETLQLQDFKYEKPIKVFKIIDSELKFNKRKQNWGMLFTYMDIKEDFEVIIKKWFSNYEKFESPFNLVLRQFYVSQYYLETLFVNVAQAAESFHRRLDIIDDTPREEQKRDFDDKLKEVLENTPENLKRWVESQISNPQHFYDTRLKYLLKEYSNIELNRMIGNHQAFIKKIKNSRNYYTHFNTAQRKDAAEGMELMYLFKRLRLLLICGFLIESGFNKILLERLIKEKTYMMFRQLIS